MSHDHPLATAVGSIGRHVGHDLDTALQGNDQPGAMTDELSIPDRADRPNHSASGRPDHSDRSDHSNHSDHSASGRGRTG